MDETVGPVGSVLSGRRGRPSVMLGTSQPTRGTTVDSDRPFSEKARHSFLGLC